MFSQCCWSTMGNPSYDFSSSESYWICYCSSMHLLVLACSVPFSSLSFILASIPPHSRFTYVDGEPSLISEISCSISSSLPMASFSRERQISNQNFIYVSNRMSKLSLYYQRRMSQCCEARALGRVVGSFAREQFQSLVMLVVRLGRYQTQASTVSPFASQFLKTFNGVSARLVQKYCSKNALSYRRDTLTTLSSRTTSTPLTFNCEKGASTYLPSKAKKGLNSACFHLSGEYSRSSSNLTQPASCSADTSSRITRKFLQVTTLPFSQSFRACSCVQQQRRSDWEWGSQQGARKLRERRKMTSLTASALAESMPLRMLLMPRPTSFSSPRKRRTRTPNCLRSSLQNSLVILVRSSS